MLLVEKGIIKVDGVGMKETLAEIEQKIDDLLDDMGNSSTQLINEYNKEYRTLRDVTIQIGRIDQRILTKKAKRELNSRLIVQSIIATCILVGGVWLYNLLYDIDAPSVYQLVISFVPIIYAVMLRFENDSIYNSIVESEESKDGLRIGLDGELLREFQQLHKLEDSCYINDDDDIEYAFMSAKLRLISALVHKTKSTKSVLGFEQYLFHGTLR